MKMGVRPAMQNGTGKRSTEEGRGGMGGFIVGETASGHNGETRAAGFWKIQMRRKS